LTKGDSPEAQAGHAEWNDVRKDTFEQFVQFAYIGDYSIPKTEKRNNDLTPPSSPNAVNGNRRRLASDASTIEPQEKAAPLFDNELRRESVAEKPHEADEDTPLNYPPLSTLGKKNKKRNRKKTIKEPEVIPEPESELVENQPDQEPAEPEVADPEPVEPQVPQVPQQPPAEPEQEPAEQASPTLVADFASLSYPLLADRDNYHGTCEPSTDFEKDHSYSKVLLSHASLYVLGNIQLIDSLKALALFKLHKTLCTFKLNKENIGDITDLARYTYSKDGNDVDGGIEIEGLRGLVCQYMGLHARELSGDVRFMKLLKEGGQIVIDFLKFGLEGNRR
jgi:hypothetical protein